MLKLRHRMLDAGGMMKSALGLILVLVGLAVSAGLDKSIEAQLVDSYPDWLTGLTTRF